MLKTFATLFDRTPSQYRMPQQNIITKLEIHGYEGNLFKIYSNPRDEHELILLLNARYGHHLKAS